GTASSAYSKRPLRKPGPCGRVRIQPYRKPTFHTPVSPLPPETEWPPPVQICHSCPPSSGRTCAIAKAVKKTKEIISRDFIVPGNSKPYRKARSLTNLAVTVPGRHPPRGSAR